MDKHAIVKSTPLQRGRGESDEKFFKRITHVNMTGKKIKKIENLDLCPNLKVLYLDDNSIGMIEGLESCPKVTHLYLQNNKIIRIEGISHLKELTKLFLDRNKISVLEGLENAHQLEELYLSNQAITEPLVLTPQSIGPLSYNLRVLDLKGNRMNNLVGISYLRCLEVLDVSQNDIKDLRDFSEIFQSCGRLVDMNTTGNPVCKTSKYRDNMIMLSPPTFRVLDGKDIDPQQRSFLLRFEMHKRKRSEAKKRGPAAAGSVMVRDKGLPPVARGRGGTIPSMGQPISIPAPGGRPMPHEGIDRQGLQGYRRAPSNMSQLSGEGLALAPSASGALLSRRSSRGSAGSREPPSESMFATGDALDEAVVAVDQQQGLGGGHGSSRTPSPAGGGGGGGGGGGHLAAAGKHMISR